MVESRKEQEGGGVWEAVQDFATLPPTEESRAALLRDFGVGQIAQLLGDPSKVCTPLYAPSTRPEFRKRMTMTTISWGKGRASVFTGHSTFTSPLSLSLSLSPPQSPSSCPSGFSSNLLSLATGLCGVPLPDQGLRGGRRLLWRCVPVIG